MDHLEKFYKKVEEAGLDKFDYTKYMATQDFSELYNSGETFYQMKLNIRLTYDQHYEYRPILECISADKVDQMKEDIKRINEQVDALHLSVYGENRYTGQGDYIGSRYGICNFSIFERSRLKDEEEDRESARRRAPECSRCGDGGCPSCEPWRFI